jgi:hypothetical protein
VDGARSAWLSLRGGQRQFRKVAVAIQAMVPEIFFFPERSCALMTWLLFSAHCGSVA